ncbi:chaperone modulator CbpM [Sphingobacterium sp. LRF_L2]|uniref:chaperone modulator CbpM n=1 Tax=Sphingobacterium sp. LRF_L2 TaxID=3369421 RepID=UPI003F5E0FF8
MANTWIKVRDLCASHQIEIQFVRELSNHGMIKIFVEKEIEFVDEEQLRPIEQFVSWYYDLELNIQGIEIAANLLQRIESLQQEIEQLKKQKHTVINTLL